VGRDRDRDQSPPSDSDRGRQRGRDRGQGRGRRSRGRGSEQLGYPPPVTFPNVAYSFLILSLLGHHKDPILVCGSLRTQTHALFSHYF